MQFSIILTFCCLSISSGYIQLSSLKTKMFHKIFVNKRIKNDFKKITSNDAYQLVSFWQDELIRATSEEDCRNQNIGLLYKPVSKHIFDNSVNLTDFKYNIISDIDHINNYYIWRPKIQICLPLPYSIKIDKGENHLKNTQLYPSFRETMYLFSLKTMNNHDKAIINNIVQSPYWNEPKHDSYKIMQYSLKTFFIDYLKYSSLKYN